MIRFISFSCAHFSSEVLMVIGAPRTFPAFQSMCYDRASWTLFFFHLSLLFPYLLYHGHSPFAPCQRLELDLPSNTKTETRCLADCALLPLSITRLIPTFAELLMRASVPADAHPFMPTFPHRYLMYHCTLCARLPTPLTCVTPHPLYALL